MAPKAVVFDFDGVILDSVDIKTRAFAALFASETPAATSRIIAHHLDNGGISRFEKFRFAYREVLHRPLSADQEKILGDRFNALVEEAISACAWVPGAREFLEARHQALPLYVCSGTPQDELRRIVDRRGMKGYFRAVRGSPDTKDKILLAIAHELGCEAAKLLMVGDAANDEHAARAVGAAFIGVVPAGHDSPFAAGTTLLSDLTSLDAALALL